MGKQIIMETKKIKNEIKIHKYKVIFSYKTYKGNYKEQEREVNAISNNQVKEVFNNWKDSIRTMTNVQILGIVKLEEDIKIIEI